MARYRLSNIAKEDLLAIARWGDEHHGVERSNQYRDTLKAHFALLAENSLLYPAVEHIRPGYRRSVCGVHSVYYRIDGEIVEIMSVLRAQDPDKHLPAKLAWSSH